MKPILFIDRDGTIIQETEDEKIEKIEKLDFLPEVVHYLRKIADEMPYHLVMVSNQDGLGTEAFPDHEFWPVHDYIVRFLSGEGITFYDIHIDEHFEHENHPNRKPGIGMLSGYLNGDFDIKNSFVIGDRATDVLLARNLGCQAIYIQSAYSDTTVAAEASVTSWADIYAYLTEVSHG